MIPQHLGADAELAAEHGRAHADRPRLLALDHRRPDAGERLVEVAENAKGAAKDESQKLAWRGTADAPVSDSSDVPCTANDICRLTINGPITPARRPRIAPAIRACWTKS